MSGHGQPLSGVRRTVCELTRIAVLPGSRASVQVLNTSRSPEPAGRPAIAPRHGTYGPPARRRALAERHRRARRDRGRAEPPRCGVPSADPGRGDAVARDGELGEPVAGVVIRGAAARRQRGRAGFDDLTARRRPHEDVSAGGVGDSCRVRGHELDRPWCLDAVGHRQGDDARRHRSVPRRDRRPRPLEVRDRAAGTAGCGNDGADGAADRRDPEVAVAPERRAADPAGKVGERAAIRRPREVLRLLDSVAAGIGEPAGVGRPVRVVEVVRRDGDVTRRRCRRRRRQRGASWNDDCVTKSQ